MTTVTLATEIRELIESGRARELRLAAAHTLTDAARECGDVHPSAVLRWEQGRMPQGRNLKAYGRYLRRLAARAVA